MDFISSCLKMAALMDIHHAGEELLNTHPGFGECKNGGLTVCQRCCLIPQHTAYRSGEELQSIEGGSPCRQHWRVHGLRQNQECTGHHEQEEVEEEQGLKEQEVREDASAKTPAHSLERHLPQLEGVQEGQPAVPTLSCSLGGAKCGKTRGNTLHNILFVKKK